MDKGYKKIMKAPEIQILLGVLRITDEEAYYHSLRVADLTEQCLKELEKRKELEWNDVECNRIIQGALLHDIGKAYIPFGLQHNSRPLNHYERAILATHPILGCEAVLGNEEQDSHYDSLDTESPFGEIVDNIILMHHANADGTGYPTIDNVSFDADNVPDYVWLVAYADRFTAMTMHRTYKAALNYSDAWMEMVNEIAKNKLPYCFSSVFKAVIQKESIVAI